MTQELLPIGSVVQLTESTALVMIAGYLPVNSEQQDSVWDYSGFKFPIGYTSDEELYCFNQEQIETVYSYGYRDIETDIFMSRLAAAIEQMNSKSAGGSEVEED